MASAMVIPGKLNANFSFFIARQNGSVLTAELTYHSLFRWVRRAAPRRAGDEGRGGQWSVLEANRRIIATAAPSENECAPAAAAAHT